MRKVIASIVIVAAVGYGIYAGIGQADTNKANHLKDEANAASAAADKLVEDAKPKFTALFSESTLAGYPGNRAENEAAAKETAELYARAVEQYRLGAAKFDEASKQKIDEDIAAYFAVWSQVLTKSAERRATAREFSLAFLDKELDTRAKLEARTHEIRTRFDVFDKAVNELVVTAKKMETDHADKLD
jgi:hypothetical protein